MFLHRRILLSSEINDPDLYQYSSSPPLPTTTLPLSDSSTAVPFHRHLSNAAIASVSASILLALTYYYVILHRRRRRLINPSDESYSSAGEETSDNDAGWAHHVWNIRTVGLDNSAILSIGSHAYLPPSGTDGGSLAAAADDCPVCLGEVEDGDMVRLLPACGHVFHVTCIDTWLRAHVSCPLCRARILPPQPNSAAEGAGGETRVRVLSDTEAPPPPPGSPARLWHLGCMPAVNCFSLDRSVKYRQSFLKYFK